MISNLYETDYTQWIEKQAIALKNHDINSLDWENLLEELFDLGRSQKKAVERLLLRLYQHVIKIVYWESERERNLNHWKVEINTFRKNILKEIKEQPSLKVYLDEIDEKCWKDAVESISEVLEIDIPGDQLVTWTIATSPGWYPNNI